MAKKLKLYFQKNQPVAIKYDCSRHGIKTFSCHRIYGIHIDPSSKIKHVAYILDARYKFFSTSAGPSQRWVSREELYKIPRFLVTKRKTKTKKQFYEFQKDFKNTKNKFGKSGS